jgi:hypothetical protein
MRARQAVLQGALAAVMLAGTLATAQAQGGARPAEVTPQALEQKATMVDRLLYNSPVAARVGSSQNADARRHFGDARELLTHARALATSGVLRGADALLNEAIREIGRAQQLVPDQTARLVEERARFQQLVDSVDALLRTYPSIDLKPDAAAAAELSHGRARTAMQQARAIADDGRVVEANRLLDASLGLLLKDALTRFDGQTLIYDRRFASTREEFAYELERHRSYEALVPLAVLEYRPSQEARALIERYLGQGRSLRDRAQAQADGNDPATGLKTLNEGIDALQRALQAAGLAVPQTMGAQ